MWCAVMGVAMVSGLAGVCGRTLRKRSSLTLLLILFFSLSLLRTVKYEYVEEEEGEIEDKEKEMEGQEGQEGYITPKEVLDVLHILDSEVSTVEAPCSRMVSLGGRITCSCTKKKCIKDGAKLVCLDPDVLPPPQHCFSLNFGIGYEFSFDEALVNYGCRVVAFDPTNSNVTDRMYRANLTQSLPTLRPRNHRGSRAPLPPSKTFHALDIGLARADKTIVLNLTEDGVNYVSNVATFYTLRSILRTLDNPRVDLMKIDIEGVEWGILNEILNAPDGPEMLQHVRQILMEVHFDFLKPSMSSEEILKKAWQTIRILRRLKEFGFHLAAYDLNNTAQTYVAFGSMRLPMFREITLIRRRRAAG